MDTEKQSQRLDNNRIHKLNSDMLKNPCSELCKVVTVRDVTGKVIRTEQATTTGYDTIEQSMDKAI